MGRRRWRRGPGEEEKEEEEEERTRGGPAVQPPTPPALFIIGGWRAGTSRRGADWQTGGLSVKDWPQLETARVLPRPRQHLGTFLRQRPDPPEFEDCRRELATEEGEQI